MLLLQKSEKRSDGSDRKNARVYYCEFSGQRNRNAFCWLQRNSEAFRRLSSAQCGPKTQGKCGDSSQNQSPDSSWCECLSYITMSSVQPYILTQFLFLFLFFHFLIATCSLSQTMFQIPNFTKWKRFSGYNSLLRSFTVYSVEMSNLL